jgi:hypothetical protein
MICLWSHLSEFVTAGEIIVQKLPDFRASITFNT